jgi:hypothetical protein
VNQDETKIDQRQTAKLIQMSLANVTESSERVREGSSSSLERKKPKANKHKT